MFDICEKFPNSIYRTIHNEGIFEGPQMLDNNELPDKAYKNSDNGGNMTKMTFRSTGEISTNTFANFAAASSKAFWGS